VGLAVGGRKPLAADVGVSLRRCHVLVTEQLLDGSQIGTAIQAVPMGSDAAVVPK